MSGLIRDPDRLIRIKKSRERSRFRTTWGVNDNKTYIFEWTFSFILTLARWNTLHCNVVISLTNFLHSHKTETERQGRWICNERFCTLSINDWVCKDLMPNWMLQDEAFMSQSAFPFHQMLKYLTCKYRIQKTFSQQHNTWVSLCPQIVHNQPPHLNRTD